MQVLSKVLFSKAFENEMLITKLREYVSFSNENKNSDIWYFG